MRYPWCVACVIAGLVLGAGCASRDAGGRTPGASQVLGEKGSRVRVVSAWFGTGSDLADVTKQVDRLLRTEPHGFLARSGVLGVEDPVPGRSKALVIRYVYRGEERIYVVTGEQRVSYKDLVRSAADDADNGRDDREERHGRSDSGRGSKPHREER